MKTIAFYLPQFHRIPENDQWWGTGYTEWTAVRSARPLFEGHDQPKVPLGENYYDLLDKNTFKLQEQWMKQYGIDGLCLYHYYFAEGRKILEKPAENLLKWKNIDIPFCFSWANETWARSWSNLNEKNVWNFKKEHEVPVENDDGILLRQEYGTEKDWEEHFEYLLSFFQDERYIKKDNKPVLILHRADTVTCLPQMLRVWDLLAKQNAFDGIYVVAANAMVKGMDAYIRQEPNYSAVNQFRQDYQWLTYNIVAHAKEAGERTYLCGCPSYDDTPRRGKEGIVYEGGTPEIFYQQMMHLYSIAEIRNHDFLFINAWNEWGEGMYLEPDERFGLSYLEALKRAQQDYKGSEVLKGYVSGMRKEGNGISSKDYGEPLLELKVLYKLMSIDQIEAKLQKLFGEKQTIALYGLGEMGKMISRLLTRSGIPVSFGVDRRPEKVHMDYLVYSPKDELPKADYMIVCVPAYYKQVYDALQNQRIRMLSVDQLADLLSEI